MRYWICQVTGWGAWLILNLFVAYKFAPDTYLTPNLKRNLFLFTLFIEFFSFILITHLLRIVLKKIAWINFSIDKVLALFILSVFVTSFASFYTSEIIQKIPPNSYDKYEINERKQKALLLEKEMNLTNSDYYLYENNGVLDSTKYVAFIKIKKATSWYKDKNNIWKYEEKKGKNFGSLVTSIILVSLWLLIYFAWHYVNKNRNNQLDKLRLEAVVKSLELKTIKSHINPHFIFNALNSIRALVDENPPRARTAITELSNILRSSLQAEKLETVPLEQELNIVKDYLALEHMRFEERLKIDMHIEPNTLTQPVPPMMLQNLVENAIKHGISKNENGGEIIIKSYFKDKHLELIVQNTGNLQSLKAGNSSGFGIRSTQDRLNLLYQNKAHFEIEEKNGNMVQSKIIMPENSTV